MLAGCARMIFDHDCVEAAQHSALAARAQLSEITMAPVRAVSEAVTAASLRRRRQQFVMCRLPDAT